MAAVSELLLKKRKRQEAWAAEKATAATTAKKNALAARRTIFKRAADYAKEYRATVRLGRRRTLERDRGRGLRGAQTERERGAEEREAEGAFSFSPARPTPLCPPPSLPPQPESDLLSRDPSSHSRAILKLTLLPPSLARSIGCGRLPLLATPFSPPP
jgi:hypothetical protein